MVEANTRKRILDELGELGTQRLGRTYTYLSGSSSLTPALISKNAVHYPDLLTEFPFVKSAPNLNSKKYPGYWIHRGQQIAADYAIVQQAYNLSSNMANLVYFLCGSNLRTVSDAVRMLSSTIAMAKEDGVNVLPKEDISYIREHCYPAELWDLRKSKTFAVNGALICAVLDDLCKKNYDVLKKANDNPEEIPKIPWLTSLRPLSKSEIAEAVTSIASHDEWHITINQLVDKGYFSAPPHLEYLLANKPVDLVNHWASFERRAAGDGLSPTSISVGI